MDWRLKELREISHLSSQQLQRIELWESSLMLQTKPGKVPHKNIPPILVSWAQDTRFPSLHQHLLLLPEIPFVSSGWWPWNMRWRGKQQWHRSIWFCGVNKELWPRHEWSERPECFTSWSFQQSLLNVFLWACLMIPIVAKQYNDWISLDTILSTLRQVPSDLDDIYRQILADVVYTEKRPLTLLLMQWIFLAKDPLSVTQFRHAMTSNDSSVRPL